MRNTLTKLREQVEDEGYEPGSERFEFRFLEVRVQKCQELQEVTLCSECKAADSCAIRSEYAQRKAFAPTGKKP